MGAFVNKSSDPTVSLNILTFFKEITIVNFCSFGKVRRRPVVPNKELKIILNIKEKVLSTIPKMEESELTTKLLEIKHDILDKELMAIHLRKPS